MPRDPGRIVQECGAGLVEVRRDGDVLSFAAPPLLRSGPVDEADVAARSPTALGIARDGDRRRGVGDNGPGWAAILLASADEVLAIRPGRVPFDIGIVGPYPAGAPAALELRAVWPQHGATVEDPVTGSLNASVAAMADRDRADPGAVIASQGTAIGRRAGSRSPRTRTGPSWTGGRSVTLIIAAVCNLWSRAWRNLGLVPGQVAWAQGIAGSAVCPEIMLAGWQCIEVWLEPKRLVGFAVQERRCVACQSVRSCQFQALVRSEPIETTAPFHADC